LHGMQVLADIEALVILAVLAGLAFLLALAAFSALVGNSRLTRASQALSGWLFGGRGLARKSLIAALMLAFFYGGTLLAVSLSSRQWILPRGQEKYFCELDCHLAYSVVAVEQPQALNPGGAAATPGRRVYVIGLRTRFDQQTVSPTRGDAPLTPGPRIVTVMDSRGRSFRPLPYDAVALAAVGLRSVPITTPLRPGQYYVTWFVFELPSDAISPRLFIRSPVEPPWLAPFLLGDEGSFLHRKVYLSLS
jgi:hypothetical protein